MARTLVPTKVVINLDKQGEFDNGIILYKVRVNGILHKYQKSIAIKNMAFSKLNLAKIIEIVIKKTKETEGITHVQNARLD